MNKNIEQALSGFSYDEQRRMRDAPRLTMARCIRLNFIVMVRALPLNTIIQPPTTDCHAQCVLRSTLSKRKSFLPGIGCVRIRFQSVVDKSVSL